MCGVRRPRSVFGPEPGAAKERVALSQSTEHPRPPSGHRSLMDLFSGFDELLEGPLDAHRLFQSCCDVFPFDVGETSAVKAGLETKHSAGYSGQRSAHAKLAS